PLPSDPDVQVAAVTKVPGPVGWCLYSAAVGTRTEKPGLMITNVSDQPVFVDSCVVKVDSSSAKVDPPAASPEARARIQRMREDLARLRGPIRPPPNPARQAFEAWKRRAH